MKCPLRGLVVISIAVTVLQWGRQAASSAGQYASSFIDAPSRALPDMRALDMKSLDLKALEHAEPHYGTQAVQRSAAGLLEWFQAQYVGQSTLGSLGQATTSRLGETSWLRT